MNSTKSLTLLLLIITLLVGACKEEDTITPEQQAEIDHQLIIDYAAANNLNGQFTASGLYYVIEEPGSIASPSINSDVTVNYRGTLLDGTIFDANDNIEFNLSGVIVGWQEGIPLFKKGGSGILIIPSGLAYGPRARSSIPANSVLVFEIELIDFK